MEAGDWQPDENTKIIALSTKIGKVFKFQQRFLREWKLATGNRQPTTDRILFPGAYTQHFN